MTNQPTITSTWHHYGRPDPDLTDWLDDAPHHWEKTDSGGREQLVIETPDGDIHPRPGSLLIRWTDNTVTVASPRCAERVYGPEGLVGRLRHAETELTRVHEARDRMAHAPAHVDAIWCLDQLDAALGIEPDKPAGADDKPAHAPHEQYRYATTWSEYHAGRRAALNDPPGSAS